MQPIPPKIALTIRASIRPPRTLMSIKTVLLPTPTPCCTRDTSCLVLERLLHLLVDRVVVVLAVVGVAAGGGEVLGVAEFAVGNAVVEAVDFGLWGLLEAFVDALVESIYRDAGFGVAGGGARGFGGFENVGGGGGGEGWGSGDGPGSGK